MINSMISNLGPQYITEFSNLHREDVSRNEDGGSDVFTEYNIS